MIRHLQKIGTVSDRAHLSVVVDDSITAIRLLNDDTPLLLRLHLLFNCQPLAFIFSRCHHRNSLLPQRFNATGSLASLSPHTDSISERLLRRRLMQEQPGFNLVAFVAVLVVFMCGLIFGVPPVSPPVPA